MARYGYSYLRPTPPKVLQRQIRQTVNSQVAPYLSQINRAETQGASTIGSYSEALAHQLAGSLAQTRANYGQAESQQAAVNAALANRMSGAGAQLSNDLAGQLAAAGQSTAPSSAVGAIGSGAANAGFASGSASLSDLLAQGAAAQQYAGQLPNLARMRGLQEQGIFRGQQEKARADILAKVPGLIDSASKQAQANEFQKAVAIQSGLVDKQKLNQAANIAATKNQTTRDIAAAKLTAATDPKTGLPYTYEARMKSINASANRSGRTYNENLSRAAGHAVDGQGRPIISPTTGKPYPYVPKPGTASAGKTLTPSQVSKFQAQGTEAAIAHKTGQYKDSKGNTVHIPKLTAMQTFEYLTRRGMRKDIAAKAVGYAYGKWLKPGDKKRLGIG